MVKKIHNFSVFCWFYLWGASGLPVAVGIFDHFDGAGIDCHHIAKGFGTLAKVCFFFGVGVDVVEYDLIRLHDHCAKLRDFVELVAGITEKDVIHIHNHLLEWYRVRPAAVISPGALIAATVTIPSAAALSWRSVGALGSWLLVIASAVALALPATVATEESNLFRDYLEGFAVVAVSVCVFAGLDSALDVNLSTFAQVLPAKLRSFTPGGNGVPFCVFDTLPAFIGIAF